MNYYLIAGEASGDLHGSNLMKEIKKLDTDARFRVWGGDLMVQAGGELVSHYKERAYMGFWEVIKNLKTITRFINQCKADIATHKPDVLILIDYPGFNLRIAEYAKTLGIKVVYYISPQVWAWKQNRVKKIKQYVDKMLVILPFEQDFYKKWNYEVDFVGHPLLDAIANHTPAELNLPTDKPIIALLPGSRQQEIAKKLPIMLSVVNDFPDYQFVIAGAPSLEDSFYQQFMVGSTVPVIYGKTYDLLSHAHAALVTSGTATLETALFEVPEVVCYKSSWLSYRIARIVVRHIKYIALVNLIMNREVVKELIQSDLNKKKLKKELTKIVRGGEKREKLLADYKELKALLGNQGASKNAAEIITSI